MHVGVQARVEELGKEGRIMDTQEECKEDLVLQRGWYFAKDGRIAAIDDPIEDCGLGWVRGMGLVAYRSTGEYAEKDEDIGDCLDLDLESRSETRDSLLKNSWLKTMENDDTAKSKYPIGMIPPIDFCCMCQKHESEVEELVMQQVFYPQYWAQRKICGECREKLSEAMAKTLKEIGW